MNGGPGTNWGTWKAKQFPHPGNYTLTPGFTFAALQRHLSCLLFVTNLTDFTDSTTTKYFLLILLNGVCFSVCHFIF